MPIITAPDGPTHQLDHACFTSLATPTRGTRETSVWRVRLEPFAPGQRHTVTREEVFVVLQGTASIDWGDTRGEARAGDAIVIPPGTWFTLSCANDNPVELLCCLPVGGQAQLPNGPTFTPPWAQ